MSRQRLLLGLILAGYLLVTLAYGVVNPLFEAPDEHWHFFTADYDAFLEQKEKSQAEGIF